MAGAEQLQCGLVAGLIGLGLVEAGVQFAEGLFGGVGGSPGVGEAGLGVGLIALHPGEGIRVGNHGGQLFASCGEGLLTGVEFAAQAFRGEALIAERRGGGAAFGILFLQPGDFRLALLEATKGRVEIGAGLADAGQVCLDGNEIVFGHAERAAGAGLAGGRNDGLSGGREPETELFDDGVEFDPGETGADTMADVRVVETGPGSGFTLAGPEETEKAPMFGLGGAAAGQRRLKQRLHALIGSVGFGDQVPRAGTELVELAIGFLQERFGEAEAAGPRFEFDHHARGEGGADGLEGFDLLALGRMSVEKGAGDGVKRGGLAGLVGGGEDIQPRGEGTEPDCFAEAPDVREFQRVEDHEVTSRRLWKTVWRSWANHAGVSCVRSILAGARSV